MPASTAPDGTTGQDPALSDPQDGTGATVQDTGPDGSSTGITDVAVLQSELAKTRAEAARSRVELKALKDADKAKADADLDEMAKLTKRQKELEEEVEELGKLATQKALEAAVARLSITLGIIDPDAAWRLLDTDELELDEDTGEPKNVEAALKALIKAKPYLAKAPDPTTPGTINGGAGAQAGPAPKLTADELAQAQTAGLTPERFAALKGVKTLDEWKKTQAAKT